MALSLLDLRNRLNTFAGLDLTATEADQLINEGYRELATRAEWTRANRDVGDTVKDQVAYTIPPNVYKILEVHVGGIPFSPTDEETIRRFEDDQLVRRTTGLWWISFTDSGTEQISLHPTPSKAGDEILALSIVVPANLVNNADTPVVPDGFDHAIISYAAARAYEGLEDNPEQSQFHQAFFDRKVDELTRLRLGRVGRGPRQVRIQGIHT